MKKLYPQLTVFCCMISQLYTAQNYLDKYLSETPVYTTIGSTLNNISLPVDLDFKPNRDELWVVNYGTAFGPSVGGSTVLFFNAGRANQTSRYKIDSYAGHFMVFPSAIAFSDQGEFANSNEIKNTSIPANPNSLFMGPALWSSDTNIYARVFQNTWLSGYPLGSHLDMLHQSPFSMGIAHDSARVYWVFDGWNGNICKYDFTVDHGAGYDTHGDGKIWRYTDVNVVRTPSVPSHMVLDKATKWLYIVDGGNKRLLRINTGTGAITGTLTATNEPVALYRAVTGATQQVIDTYTTQPCGIDFFNNRLIVSDHTTGDIRIYDTGAPTPTLMGTISTGQPGIMGVKLGPDGKIWFVNNVANTVVRIDIPATNDDASISEISAPLLENYEPKFHHPGFNVCNNSVSPVVTLNNSGANNLTSANINYKLDNAAPATFSWTGNLAPGASATVTLPSLNTVQGSHKLIVFTSNPNGVADKNPLNDTKEGSFRSIGALKSLPFSETFSTSTFPPLDWAYLGFNKYCPMSRVAGLGAYGATDGCLKMDNENSPLDISGQTDFLLSPLIDLKNTDIGTQLEFDVAYARYASAVNDRLEVKASTDCGVTWTTIYNKFGATLATTTPTTSFNNPQAHEWRPDTVKLNQFVGNEVLFMFKSTSNFGNNFFLDNVMINLVPLGLAENKEQGILNIFPNPSSGRCFIKIKSDNLNSIEVVDLLGRPISAGLLVEKGRNLTTIDLTGQTPGTYYVKINTTIGSTVKKLVILEE